MCWKCNLDPRTRQEQAKQRIALSNTLIGIGITVLTSGIVGICLAALSNNNSLGIPVAIVLLLVATGVTVIMFATFSRFYAVLALDKAFKTEKVTNDAQS